jgi:hypothetical protein
MERGLPGHVEGVFGFRARGTDIAHGCAINARSFIRARVTRSFDLLGR